MRILLVTDFFLSGQSMHVLELAKQLRSLGHQLHLLLNRVYTTTFDTDYRYRLNSWGVVTLSPIIGPRSR